MKIYLTSAALLSATTSLVSAQEPACGPISIAGSSTVKPVAEAWTGGYTAESSTCPRAAIAVEGGGSSSGAGRVCANADKGTPVLIGDMSRGWKSSEASNDDPDKPWLYSCLKGDTTRSAIQIDVAIDGLSVASAAGGPGAACVMSMGGLSPDQLRWIYSSYDEATLIATGWDASSIVSDGDDMTHLWSELSPSCPAVEIKIAGADHESGTYEYFLETILADHDNGETFDTMRPDGYFNSAVDEDLVLYLEDNSDAIAYFGYAYYLENADFLEAAAIQNDAGEYVLPTGSDVASGAYNPLARRIYMNLLNDPEALALTGPLIEYGFSDAGDALVAGTGYVPIPEAEQADMLARIGL